jgi:hypothetical protein
VAEADHRPGVAAHAWMWATVGLTLGSLLAVIALAPPVNASPGRALSWLLFTGSSVHVASTGALFIAPSAREYARRHRVRCLWVPAGLTAGAAGAAALLTPAAFQWLLLPYFAWQFYHYQKQNLGVAALAAASHRAAPLSRTERRALLLAGVAAIGRLIADPALLGLRIDPGIGWLRPVSTAAFIVAVGAGITGLVRRPAAARPRGFTACYLTALLFGLPAFVFSSPYAAVGGMTVAHGLQYLLLVWMVTNGAADGSGTKPVRFALLGNVD